MSGWGVIALRITRRGIASPAGAPLGATGAIVGAACDAVGVSAGGGPPARRGGPGGGLGGGGPPPPPPRGGPGFAPGGDPPVGDACGPGVVGGPGRGRRSGPL